MGLSIHISVRLRAVVDVAPPHHPDAPSLCWCGEHRSCGGAGPIRAQLGLAPCMSRDSSKAFVEVWGQIPNFDCPQQAKSTHSDCTGVARCKSRATAHKQDHQEEWASEHDPDSLRHDEAILEEEFLDDATFRRLGAARASSSCCCRKSGVCSAIDAIVWYAQWTEKLMPERAALEYSSVVATDAGPIADGFANRRGGGRQTCHSSQKVTTTSRQTTAVAIAILRHDVRCGGKVRWAAQNS